MISCFQKRSSLFSFKGAKYYGNWCDYLLFRGGLVVCAQAVVASVILIVRNVMEVRDREKQEFQGR